MTVWSVVAWLAAAPSPLAPVVTAVEVLWLSPGDDYGSAQPAYVRADDDVRLAVALHLADGSVACRHGAYRTAAGKDLTCAQTLESFGPLRVTYLRVLPARLRVRRTARGQALGNPPQDRCEAFATVRVDAEVLATEEDGGEWVGSHRFAARLDLEGADPITSGPLGVRVRASDAPTGVLMELQGVPVVDAARGTPASQHETETHQGLDPVSAIPYVMRRMGLPWPYGDVPDADARVTRVTGAPREGDILRVGGGSPRLGLVLRGDSQRVWFMEVTDAGIQKAVLDLGTGPPPLLLRPVGLPTALPEPAPRKLQARPRTPPR